MKSIFNSILVTIAALLSIPLIFLGLFNLGGGVDCVTYQGSSSCSAPEKVFYFPECKTDLIKYAEDERRLKEFKKAHPGPVSPGGGSPIIRLKCGLHNYFHPYEAIFNSNKSEIIPDAPSTSENNPYKLSKEESDQAWEKLLSSDKEEKNNSQPNRTPTSLTNEEKIISRFNELDKTGPAICKTINNISIAVAENLSSKFSLDPRGISFARSWYKPLSVTRENLLLFGALVELEILEDLNPDKFKQVSCQIVLYTQNGLLNCYAMESDINSGVISKLYACKKP